MSDLGNTVIGHSFTVDKPVFDTVDLDSTVIVGRRVIRFVVGIVISFLCCLWREIS